MIQRGSGILLHITSLPSPYGVGDFGPWAYKFADFLAQTGQRYWQILPLNPTNRACGNSPYSVISAFAGNTNLISPELLMEDGFLSDNDVASKPDFLADRCDYDSVISYKEKLLARAYKHLGTHRKAKSEFRTFCQRNSEWLDDFALFSVLREKFHKKPWYQWKKELRDRQPKVLRAAKQENSDAIYKTKFLQYLFFRQWLMLKAYCNGKGIKIIGDIPIYVDYNSVDAWAHPEIFKLNGDRNLSHISGVPPDYFSTTGQLWGNPVYRWDILEKTGFLWWIKRMEYNLTCFDMTRIDHFRGLVAYWEVKAGEETAVNGQWVRVPTKKFFNTLLKHFKRFPIIAEDLGVITPDVREVMDHYGFPGMKVLLFAFGEHNPRHPYLPHSYNGSNWVVYTGTHDNNTVKGWFETEARPDEKERIMRYIGRGVATDEVNWELIRLAMMSVAGIAMFPLQDVLGLGGNARMNIPSTAQGNWEWRVIPEQLTDSVSHRLRTMTEIYGRAS